MLDGDSPLIKALPPESDYITYLTIIEYNLNKKNLPTLHHVLQDETLTTNIGWDLVHLLIPELPESEDCLRDVARLGNPREVILKVTECLRLIDFDSDPGSEAEHLSLQGKETTETLVAEDLSSSPTSLAPVDNIAHRASHLQLIDEPPPLPLPVQQFITLLSMLTVLHKRIKTKFPSRFLSTTLQAVLASFSNSASHREEMILAIAKLVKDVTGASRPPLPNRHSSGVVPKLDSTNISEPAQDPEAPEGWALDPQESLLQRRLLQSFVTHTLVEYMLNFQGAEEESPGMAWCSRVMELLHPERVIPLVTSFTERFSEDSFERRRVDGVGQIVALAKELRLTDNDLLDAARTPEKLDSENEDDEAEPPSAPEEIPLSRLGSVMLLAARKVSTILHDSLVSAAESTLTIFPNHFKLIRNCLASPGTESSQLGMEPEALLDAILALGILSIEANAVGTPESDKDFNDYLQITALISSNCPSPNLRGHAHYLTSTVLRSHPDADARLAFIRDTLEHCPFDNLKVSAIGWIKGETIEANLSGTGERREDAQQQSVFATPMALSSLAPFLFPSLHAELTMAPIRDAYLEFRSSLSFYLSSLNFLYLLLSVEHLHDKLQIPNLWTNHDIAGSYLQALRDAKTRFENGFDNDLHGDKSPETIAELNVLDETLSRVTKAANVMST